MAIQGVDLPQDCTVLVGIPNSLEDYDDFRMGRAESDFLTRCCTTRMKFMNEVMEPVTKNLIKAASYGCGVYLKANEANVSLAFQKKVVIIFSHWANNCLELDGKMVPDKVFCGLIPADFQGIVDVCACQPEDNLVVSIKNRAPGATVKCTLTKITPSFWAEIIQLTIYLLHEHTLNYRQASTQVLKQIFKTYNNTKK